MYFRGTNWGALACPLVYTSYDYGAAIRESRALSPKYTEQKLQGLFIRSSPDFRKTDWLGDTASVLPADVKLTNLGGGDGYATVLKNLDTDAGFVILRQNDSTAT
jgi:hypothetical protein